MEKEERHRRDVEDIEEMNRAQDEQMVDLTRSSSADLTMCPLAKSDARPVFHSWEHYHKWRA